MTGRIHGEFWARDFGLAVALKHCAYGRWRWELFVLVGPVSLSIGFLATKRSR